MSPPSLPTVGASNDTWGTELNTWLATVKTMFNVEDYGGVNPTDTDRILGAVNAASNAGGGIARAVGRKYTGVAGVTLKPFVRLVGDLAQAANSANGTIFAGTGGSDIITVQVGTDSYTGIEHIAFSGGKNQVVFGGGTTSHVFIEHCVFGSPTEAGIRISSGSMEELYVTRCRGSGGAYFFKHDNVTSGGLNYLDKTEFRNCIANGQTENAYRIEVNISNTVSWVNPIINTTSKHGFYADGSIRGWTFINPNTEGIGSAGKKNRTTFTGTVSSGATSATLASATGWATGDGMTITGAGTNGRDFTILATSEGGAGVTVSGTTVSWTGGTNTTVTTPAVTNAIYDEFRFASTIATSEDIQFLGGSIGNEGTNGKIRYAVNCAGGYYIMFNGTKTGMPVNDPNTLARSYLYPVDFRRPTTPLFQRYDGADPIKAGIPTDGDFVVTPPDGTRVVDSSNNRAYVRVGGTWKYSALT